ncbi:unnamed protein product [Rhizoctonia solani]|uniref:Uncharacterized protein n=1 Tax=Rhizoctonia solani TaxID=456999 RepID=A0A8H2XJA1_9AGAM|nr:unnamed protein product [Rhizoctonia solani]
MAEYLTNPDAYNYTPASSPPSSPIPFDTLSNDSEDEYQVDSPWKMESDPYSANAKATQSPLLHTRTKRQTYGILTPSSSFNSYGPSSPAPTLRSNASTPIRVQSKYTPSKDPVWESSLNDVFHNGDTVINLDSSNITTIPREIIDLNNMVSLPLEPPESPQPPPVHSPTTPSRSTIASAAARSRRVFSQSRSNNSLFSSGSPSKPKREIQLYLANNNLTVLPSELFQLNNLTLLSLRGNKLVSLPPAIGNLKSLRSLNIANNQFTSLPSELSYLKLQTLFLHPNPFLPKPAVDPTSTDGPNDCRDTSLPGARELGPLVTHTRIPKLTELALRATLRPTPNELPKITPISFTTPTTRLSNTSASKSLLTPTDSHSSVFSFPSHTPPLSRSNSSLNPYNSHTFPPHGLELEDRYDLNLWLSQQRTPNIHIRAARHGTEDACNLYSWCPGQKHRADSESEASSSGMFVLPLEERLEWVSILAGCELCPAVPILWRGCSAGCLGFLDMDISAPLQERDEREEDEEFMSGFSKASQVNPLPNEEMVEASTRVQTHIVWDDMMDLDG